MFGHGFLFNRGEKMSKSVGNVIDPIALADTYGVDQLRYFFMREVPFGQDGNYSHEAIVNRINADLANDLGNLAQRSLSMIAKNCDAAVPSPAIRRKPTAISSALADSTAGEGEGGDGRISPSNRARPRSGRSSPRRTGISRRRSRGCCASRIRPAWRPCSM